jgi:hypothetical protein
LLTLAQPSAQSQTQHHNNRFDLDGHRPRCPLPPFCVPFWRGGEPPFVSFSTYLILCCLVLGMCVCVHFSRSPGGKNEKARISQCAPRSLKGPFLHYFCPTVGPKGRVRIVGGLPTCMKVEMVYNVWALPASGVGMPPPLVGGLFVEIDVGIITEQHKKKRRHGLLKLLCLFLFCLYGFALFFVASSKLLAVRPHFEGPIVRRRDQPPAIWCPVHAHHAPFMPFQCFEQPEVPRAPDLRGRRVVVLGCVWVYLRMMWTCCSLSH